jgi:hypothetical protein|tara:strand:- start:3325 stop:3744 length:420 start_codon:yes stop_codon:yes gene_type:complete
MPRIDIKLPLPVNPSLTAKPSTVASATEETPDSGAWDIVYFSRINFSTGDQIGDVVRLGECIALTNPSAEDELTTYTIGVQTTGTELLPEAGDYIFFGKDTRVNTSGLKGYYSEVEMSNDSTLQAELFSVSSEITLSSK